MAKARRGLDGRHRDKSGKIDRKHGNTRVAALRKSTVQVSPRAAVRT